MPKALIVYGTTTGNTELVAEQVSGILEEKGVNVTMKNVTETTIGELGNGFDVTLLGCSTWGEDTIEFQEDFEPFYENLDSAELKEKKVALFGCGDSSYEYYCGAVDLLEDKMDAVGGKRVNESLRIDGDPSESSGEIDEWAAEVADSI